jgi:hypothetical protein
VPVYLLISPDGKLVARCNSVEEIKKEIAAALDKK